MFYVSPFQGLGIVIDSNLEKTDLQLAKKRRPPSTATDVFTQ
jgi:hypothetical protein